jgi:hypothetical protein
MMILGALTMYVLQKTDPKWSPYSWGTLRQMGNHISNHLLNPFADDLQMICR